MASDTLKTSLKNVVFRVAKTMGLFRLTKWLTRNELLILCYHGFELADEASFRPELFMRADEFATRLKTLRRYGCPVVPLGKALEDLRNGTLPANAVCLTIDDGFYSVLARAVPLLGEHRFPATLYVTSYYAAKCAPVFRLVVQYMFWKTTVAELDAGDQPWDSQGPVDLTDPEARKDVMWRIIEFGERHCEEPDRQEISRALGHRLGVEYDFIERTRMLSLLNVDEIRQLGAAGIDVQLHTHRHRLPVDDEATVRRELTENAKFLEDTLGRPVKHLCYPSGIWDRSQWPWLSDIGIESATTCDPGFNSADTPMLGLYRVLDDSTVSQIAFEAELCGFSEMLRRIRGRRRHGELKRKASPTIA
jgi:peptidoglycan/xylan/chitin deacetylase (PgdA/CDA1 family)